VQKTAGVSLETLLREKFPDIQTWCGRHGHARDGVAEMGADRWGEYFSFAFVRNPWERLVSWYAMIERRRERLPLHKRWSKAPFDTLLWNQIVQKGRDFPSFLENCTDVVFDKGCNKSFAFNQLDYLAGADDALLVNFVGRFERLSEDAAHVFERLGLNGVALPHRNVSAHDHYSRWYDDHTRELVAQRFARDIKTFGYRFEQA
jgi:hypothetical protein